MAFVVGSTYRFQRAFKMNARTWDLTDATVTLILKGPSGVTSTKTATITDAARGIAEYVTDADDLDEAGGWTRAWRVVQGSIDQTDEPIPFLVQASP